MTLKTLPFLAKDRLPRNRVHRSASWELTDCRVAGVSTPAPPCPPWPAQTDTHGRWRLKSYGWHQPHPRAMYLHPAVAPSWPLALSPQKRLQPRVRDGDGDSRSTPRVLKQRLCLQPGKPSSSSDSRIFTKRSGCKLYLSTVLGTHFSLYGTSLFIFAPLYVKTHICHLSPEVRDFAHVSSGRFFLFPFCL